RPVVPVRHTPRSDATWHDPALRAATYLDRLALAGRSGRLGLSRSALPAIRTALPVPGRVRGASRWRNRRPGHAPAGEANDVRARDIRLPPRSERQGKRAGAASILHLVVTPATPLAGVHPPARRFHAPGLLPFPGRG